MEWLVYLALLSFGALVGFTACALLVVSKPRETAAEVRKRREWLEWNCGYDPMRWN